MYPPPRSAGCCDAIGKTTAAAAGGVTHQVQGQAMVGAHYNKEDTVDEQV